jgi:hypothetical protein
MRTAGIISTTLNVTIGDHEGKLDSVQELRDELTEGRWLSAHLISVSLQPSDWEHTSLTIRLASQQPVLFVFYHSGTVQTRETLRAVVERTLPNLPDPRRHRRWVGAIFGIAYSATWLLIASRIPTGHWSIHTGWSRAVRDGLLAATFVVNATIGGTLFPGMAFDYWFPPLERLPDTAKTHWDRRRSWIQWGLGIWVTVVIGLLALPVTK